MIGRMLVLICWLLLEVVARQERRQLTPDSQRADVVTQVIPRLSDATELFPPAVGRG